jgi:hypothetical protein
LSSFNEYPDLRAVHYTQTDAELTEVVAVLFRDARQTNG